MEISLILTKILMWY